MLTQKPVCVITGAWWDICSEVAIRLSSKYSLALIWKTQKKLEKVLAWLEKWDHRIYPCDITNDEDIMQTIKDIITNQWKPSALINGATAFWEPQKLHENSFQEIDQATDTNFSWPLKLMTKVIDWMKENWWWNIITIWSTCYNDVYYQRLLYAATKSAMHSANQTAGVEYLKDNIKFQYVYTWPTVWGALTGIVTKRAAKNNKDFEELKAGYAEVNWWEIMSPKNTVDAIEMILNWTLSVPSGATIWIDNFGIFDDSDSRLASEEHKEHTFVKNKKRKYLVLRSELSPKIQDKKTKTLCVEFLKKTLNISKYAAIWLLILLGAKNANDYANITWKIKEYMVVQEEEEYKLKDYDRELEKLAKEKYGIEDWNSFTEKMEKDVDLVGIYSQILKDMENVVKKYEDKGYVMWWSRSNCM